MRYCLFLFYLFIWCCILTEEKGVDLGQKKDSYFDNCCHNWPITGKTAVSYDLFWDDWRLSVFYTPQSIRWSVLLFLFSFLLCSTLRLGFWKRRRWRILPFVLTEANINSAWQSILPKRKRHQASFRETCHRMEMIVANVHKLCLEWFITFYNLKCLHFIDLLRIVMFTPFICHAVLMYEQFCCIRPH